MKQYKKLFKMYHMYYLLGGLFVFISSIVLLYNSQQENIWWSTLIYDEIKKASGLLFDVETAIMELKDSVINNSISNLFRSNRIIIMGLFIINLIKAVTKINRKSIEFMATLPVTKMSNTIFGFTMDSLLIVIIYGCTYFFERMYISQHEIFTLCSEVIIQRLNKVVIVMIVSDILIVALIKLLEVVTSNGILAYFIAMFDYISLNYIFVNILGESSRFVHDKSIRFFFPINDYVYYENGVYIDNMIYSTEGSEFFKLITTVLIATVVFFIVALYYSKKVDYSRGGLFYFNLPRYVNLGIIVTIMGIYLVNVYKADYNIFIKIDTVIACVIGLLLINYYISPRKVRNKIA